MERSPPRGSSGFLGRLGEVCKYYQKVINICTDMKFRPELALSRLLFAGIVLEHYSTERKETLEHLDFAIEEVREVKTQPSLELAMRHEDILIT